MRGKEVSIQLVSSLMPACEHRGIHCDPLMHDLGLGPTELADPSWRISWDVLVVFLERLSSAAGGNHVLADMVHEANEAHLWMHLLALFALTPKRFYLLIVERVLRKMASHIGVRVESMGEDSIRTETVIPDGYQPCLAFHHGLLGAIRSFPRLLGLPAAAVEADISPRRAAYVATLTPSSTRGAQALEPLRNLVPRSLHATGRHDGPALILDESEIVERVVSFGQQLAWQTHPRELGSMFRHFMQQRFCSRHVVLWLKPPGLPAAEPVYSWSVDGLHHHVVRPLLVGQVEVGRLEVDLPAATLGERIPLFEALLPWLAQGAANVLHARTTKAPTVDELAQRWKLTPRESQALHLLMAGASNREMAKGLCSSLKTVEYHMGNLLRKAGAANRSALMARLIDEERETR